MNERKIKLLVTSGLLQWETMGDGQRKVVVARIGLDKVEVTGDGSSVNGFRQEWCQSCESRAGLSEDLQEQKHGQGVETMRCRPTGRTAANMFCAGRSKGGW